MGNAPRPLDARIEIVTPENIAFQYVLAGPFRRLPAYLIDCTLCAVLLIGTLFAMTFAAALIGAIGIGMWLVLAFVISWFYFGLFETFWNGQTPGKRLMGLRVLTADGEPINAMQAIGRNVLRNMDAMPILPLVGAGELGIPFYMLGLVTMAANARYQRLGDLACNTIVVVEGRRKLRGLMQIGRPEVVQFARELPMNVSVPRALAHALSVYVARRELFSPARRFEIARIMAEPLSERWALPPGTNPDLLLCALYQRAFFNDALSEESIDPQALSGTRTAAPVLAKGVSG